MLKLVASDDTLSINDGDMVLSRWVCDSHSGKIMVRDAFGFPITESKLPVETQNGIRTEASDVIADIGANFKGVDFSYYYLWIALGKYNDIESLDGGGYGYKNNGTGTLEVPIKNVQVATFDGTSSILPDNYYLNNVEIYESIGLSTPSIVGDEIQFTAGSLEYIRLSNGWEYFCKESNGNKWYGTNNRPLLEVIDPTNGSLSIPAGKYLYDNTKEITIEATPDGGYSFLRFKINGVSYASSNSLTITIDKPTRIEAEFATVLYVDSTATGAGDGSSWNDAFTTTTAAHTAASDGQIIEISGGSAGLTYDNSFTVTKAVTFRGSKELGKDGQVTLGTYHTFNCLTGYTKYINCKLTSNNSYPFRLLAGASVEFIESRLGAMEGTLYPTLFGGNFKAVNTKFECLNRTTITTNGVINGAGVNNIQLINCEFDLFGVWIVGYDGSSFCANNVRFGYDGASTVSSAIDIGNNPSTNIMIENSEFVGVHPIISGVSSKPPIVRNTYWRKAASVTGVGGDKATFDSSNKAIVISEYTNELPYYTNPRSNTIGQVCIRYDDLNSLTEAIATADIFNPEMKLSAYVNLHGWSIGTRPTAQDIDDMRYLLSKGNEIGCHGATHSDSGTLDFFNISATGTNPTLDITTTQIGDSSLWTGTITITINSVSQAFNLVTYKGLEELLTQINGLSIGDGTVTATTATSRHSAYLLTLCAANVSSQSISSNYVVQLEDDAYIQFEQVEAIEDIESYILNGTDRNGENEVVGMTLAPPSAYICKGVAMSYGRGRPSVKAKLITLPNIIIASSSGGSGSTYNLFNWGRDCDMYDLPYMQMTGVDADLFAIVNSAATSSLLLTPLYHGGAPEWGGSVQGFKELAMQFGVGTETLTGYAERIINDNSWTVNRPMVNFVGDINDYINKGDFTLLPESPIVKGNAEAIVTIQNQNVDFWDTKSDTAYPALLKYGYDVYAEIGDETNQSKWIYVILANGVSQDIDVPAGYTASPYFTVPPNAGFSNTGATIDWVNGDAGLQAIADAYSIPNPATFQQLKDLDLETIPESDFRYDINEEGTVITNIIAQPYQQYLDVDGNPVYTQGDKEFWVIKTF